MYILICYIKEGKRFGAVGQTVGSVERPESVFVFEDGFATTVRAGRVDACKPRMINFADFVLVCEYLRLRTNVSVGCMTLVDGVFFRELPRVRVYHESVRVEVAVASLFCVLISAYSGCCHF